MRIVAVNERGARIGEGHPKATLTDHEVDLLRELLDERTELLRSCRAVGMSDADIERTMRKARLSYGLLATAFEVSKSTVYRINTYAVRAQTVAGFKRVG